MSNSGSWNESKQEYATNKAGEIDVVDVVTDAYGETHLVRVCCDCGDPSPDDRCAKCGLGVCEWCKDHACEESL